MQLKQLGHSVDKVEFIVMGGTFMALPEDYRDYFIRNLHDALSGHTSNNVAEAVRYLMNSSVEPGRGLCLTIRAEHIVGSLLITRMLKRSRMLELLRITTVACLDPSMLVNACFCVKRHVRTSPMT